MDNSEAGDETSYKNKAEGADVLCKKSYFFHGQHKNITKKTNQCNCATTVEHWIFPNITNCQ